MDHYYRSVAAIHLYSSYYCDPDSRDSLASPIAGFHPVFIKKIDHYSDAVAVRVIDEVLDPIFPDGAKCAPVFFGDGRGSAIEHPDIVLTAYY